MPAPAALTVDRASDARMERAAELVGPLLIQGKTVREIAAALGISKSAAGRDVQLCKNYWQERIAQAGEEWRYKAVQQYEFVLKELHEQWEKHKDGKRTVIRNPDGSETVKIEAADLKSLAAIVNTTKEVTTLLGIRQPDTVARVEVDQETRAALAPMDRASYLAMLSGGMPAGITVDARPRAEGAIDVDPIESAE
jgi:hypothetical protein